MNRIKKVLRLTKNFIFVNDHKWLTIKIVIYSGYYRFLVRYLSKDKLESKMGNRGCESIESETKENLDYAFLIGLRVSRICDNTYWESKCLIKALTAQRLLVEKKIASTLYLGVTYEKNILEAHAWLRCGELYITGGNGKGYAMVAKFSK